MKKVLLKFDKDRTTVSGFKYGRQVFDEQVKPSRKNEEHISVEFPDNIELVGMSFVQGFVNSIAEQYGGTKNVKKHLSIKSKRRKVLEKFMEALGDND